MNAFPRPRMRPPTSARTPAVIGLSAATAAAAAGLAAAGGQHAVAAAVSTASAAAFGLVAVRSFVTARPVTAIAAELTKLAGGDGEPRPLPGQDQLTAGWNRVVGLARLSRAKTKLVDAAAPAETSGTIEALPIAVLRTDGHGLVVESNRAADLIVPPAEGVADTLAGRLPEVTELVGSRRAVCSRSVTRGEGEDRVHLDIDRRRLPDGGAVWTVRDVTQARLAESARDEFVTGVAHELRSPLTNIRAYAELLVEDDDVDVEERKNFCNVINDEAVRLSRFIDDLLDVSRLEAGAMTAARHVTDLAKLVDDVVTRVGPGVRAKPLTFETSVAPKLPEMSVDKDKLAAAVMNLIGNARKYTPEGGTVRLTVAADDEAVTFEVEDSGIGISAEDLPRVFDKFYRAGDERVGEVTGSGLGLAFVREVARLHGGSVSVRSELHHGSVFTLTVPRQPGGEGGA